MSKNREIELLAPGGDIESIKAAIIGGANAIYCGIDRFNARNRAENITIDSLPGILHLAHKHECKIFLTLNIIILESEFPSLFTLLNKLVNTSIDGVIVQDIGLFYLLKNFFPRLSVHASTQCTTHNAGQLTFLQQLGADRVNLCRELSIPEIAALTSFAHSKEVEVEVFVHGSNCISISGLCYMSSLQSGNSGNRGRCSQPCRDAYEKTAADVEYPLNLKDKSGWNDLKALADASVDSLKIEGRIKKSHYVYTVVNSWREQLQRLYNKKELLTDDRSIRAVFNRDFSNGYLSGTLNKDMFIDNPRDNSALHLAKNSGLLTEESLDEAKRVIYNSRTEIIQDLEEKLKTLDATKEYVDLSFSGAVGKPLEIKATFPSGLYSVQSTTPLKKAVNRSQSLCASTLEKRFKFPNESEFILNHIHTKKLGDKLIIPFKELTTLKNTLIKKLYNGRSILPAVELPTGAQNKVEKIPTLAVLISDFSELQHIPTDVAVYFALPNHIPEDISEIRSFFEKNNTVIPWFPALLIGKEFENAVALLDAISPKRIITENSGIAFEAYKHGIEWIAGPQFNGVNSYTLQALKEEFACKGAFISNELKHNQIRNIKAPHDFELHFSIFHPSVLMTSRQCFFHQVTGCEKHRIDDTCISHCNRLSTITDLKNRTMVIEKSPGNYHRIFNDKHCLNTQIVHDLSPMFDSFLIDLRPIKTDTEINIDRKELFSLFKDLLKDTEAHEKRLYDAIQETENSQYMKGL